MCGCYDHREEKKTRNNECVGLSDALCLYFIWYVKKYRHYCGDIDHINAFKEVIHKYNIRFIIKVLYCAYDFECTFKCMIQLIFILTNFIHCYEFDAVLCTIKF